MFCEKAIQRRKVSERNIIVQRNCTLRNIGDIVDISRAHPFLLLQQRTRRLLCCSDNRHSFSLLRTNVLEFPILSTFLLLDLQRNRTIFSPQKGANTAGSRHFILATFKPRKTLLKFVEQSPFLSLFAHLTLGMVNAARGTLITCDPAVKEFIRSLEHIGFGVVELDDEHLLLFNEKPDTFEVIQQKLDELLDQHTFELNAETSKEKAYRVEYKQ